jgi:transposase
VHKDTVVATVRVPGEQGRRHEELYTFGTSTHELLAPRDCLKSWAVSLVGMEATGVYWKPVYYVLEDDFECWLLNARHMRTVPGRKTDIADSAWIAQLIEHGLVRPSFVPPKPIRDLRDLTRYRKVQIEERGREAQRLDRVPVSRPSSSVPAATGASTRSWNETSTASHLRPHVDRRLPRPPLAAEADRADLAHHAASPLSAAATAPNIAAVNTPATR